MTEKPVAIDCHSHYLGLDAIREIDKQGTRLGVEFRPLPGGGRLPVIDGRPANRPLLDALSDVKQRLDFMASARLDIQLVSPWIDLAAYNLEPQLGAVLSRIQNEAIRDLVTAHRSRFVGSGAVPLQKPELAAAELEHCAKVYAFRAVQIGTNVNGLNLDEPELDPFWARAQELDMTVLLHPHQVGGVERLKRHFLPLLVAYPGETTIAAASLILGGVLERFPRLKVCLPHGGGFLPYQLGRIEHGFQARDDVGPGLSQSPSHYFRRFYFDSIVHDVPALAFLIERAGPDRVVLGTDFPFDLGEEHPVDRLEGVPGLSPREREAVLSGNVQTMLGLRPSGDS